MGWLKVRAAQRPRGERSSGPRRVLLVSATGQLGGAELSLVDLAETLDAARWRPCVIAPTGPLTERLRASGIEVIACPWLMRPKRQYTPRALWSTWRTLARGRRFIRSTLESGGIDLVHANTTAAALYVASAPGRLPTVVPTIWHVRDLRRGPELLWLKGSVDGIVCVSNACRHSLPWRSNAVPVDVIPSGIALDGPEKATDPSSPTLRGLATRGSTAGGSRSTLVAVGHFAKWKGYDRLLRALAIVRARRVDVVLDVLGDDPFGGDASAREQLAQQTSALGLSPFVSFRGMVADPRPFLRKATCLVHAAYPEPFGRVIVEAASCGCPVIALAGDHGPAEILWDGVGGCLVPRHDPKALADAIVAVVSDPRLSARLLLGVEQKVQRLYDRRVTTRQIERFYASVLERTSLRDRADFGALPFSPVQPQASP